MTTWVLTPNAPDPFTGFANPILGWHLTLATALDVSGGCNFVFATGWVSQLTILADSAPDAPIWQLNLTKGKIGVTVNDTDWCAFDGVNVWAIPEEMVNANYTVTQKV